MVILNDLDKLEVYQVYKEGKLIAQEGKALFEIKSINDSKMRNSVNIKPLTEGCFSIVSEENGFRVIGLQPHSLVTKDLWRNVDVTGEKYTTDEGKTLLKIAVIERHNATGNIGLGLVEGLGLKNGAIASTVAHDSHNIVVIGDSDLDMRTAAEHLQEIGGGIAIASGGSIICSLSLPIGGLMSDIPLEQLQEQLEDMLDMAYNMGVSRDYDPFMTLAFLALPVIPELKVTDLGLFDVVNFRFTKIDEV
jgi:adenine deaminase